MVLAAAGRRRAGRDRGRRRAIDPALVGSALPIEGSIAGRRAARTGAPSGSTTSRADCARLGDRRRRTGLLVPLLFRGRALGVLGAFDRLAADRASRGGRAPDGGVRRERRDRGGHRAERRERGAAPQHRGGRDASAARWARELHDETLQELGGAEDRCSSSARRQRRSGDARRRDRRRRRPDRRRDPRPARAHHRPAAGRARRARHRCRRSRRSSSARARSAASTIDVRRRPRIRRAAGRQRRLTPAIELTVYRLVQEALTNAARARRRRRRHDRPVRGATAS